MAIPKQLLSELKETYDCNIFFETGLYHGFSARIALDLGFEKVISIEILQRFIDMGKEKFSKEISDNRYFIIPDDSSNLGQHLSRVENDRIIFWFDAHVDNALTDAVCEPSSMCPVIQEINSLASLKEKPIILVDDIRIIKNPKPWGDNSENAVTVEKIVAAINELPFEYDISYRNSALSPADILVAT
tara:strand:- start:34 stop:597 length:564 start_codon:yes stop_codon:yes gene_type:complete